MIKYISKRLEGDLRDNLSRVVSDVDALIPQNEKEFSEIQKLGLYPAEQCVAFITRQGTPSLLKLVNIIYLLNNTSYGSVPIFS